MRNLVLNSILELENWCLILLLNLNRSSRSHDTLPVHKLFARFYDIVVVLIVVAIVVQLPLLLSVLPTLFMLGLLSPSLFLGVVDLVDVFISLDQIN